MWAKDQRIKLQLNGCRHRFSIRWSIWWCLRPSLTFSQLIYWPEISQWWTSFLATQPELVTVSEAGAPPVGRTENNNGLFPGIGTQRQCSRVIWQLTHDGLSQRLVRNWIPPPHVLEQLSYELHAPQLPSCFKRSGVNLMQKPLKQCCKRAIVTMKTQQSVFICDVVFGMNSISRPWGLTLKQWLFPQHYIHGSIRWITVIMRLSDLHYQRTVPEQLRRATRFLYLMNKDLGEGEDVHQFLKVDKCCCHYSNLIPCCQKPASHLR